MGLLSKFLKKQTKEESKERKTEQERKREERKAEQERKRKERKAELEQKKKEKQRIREERAAEERARREKAEAEEKARKERVQAEFQKQLDEYTFMREKAVKDGNISTVNELDWYIKRVKAQMRGDSDEVFMCTREIVAIEERRGGVIHKPGDGLTCVPFNPYDE